MGENIAQRWKLDLLEDSASDADITGEGTLLVDVGTLDGGLGGLEAESNLLVESDTGGGLFSQEFFGVKENSLLLLESFLGLQSHSKSELVSLGSTNERICGVDG